MSTGQLDGDTDEIVAAVKEELADERFLGDKVLVSRRELVGVAAGSATVAGLLATETGNASAQSSGTGRLGDPTPFEYIGTESLDTDELSVTNSLYDIREYGAVGDGTTDNQVAIQDAIDDAEADGGGLVVIPAGDFYCGGKLNIISGSSLGGLVGVGDESLLRFDDHDANGIRVDGSSGITLRDFKLIGNSASGVKQQGILCTQSSDITIRNVTSEDWAGDGIVWYDGCDNVRVIDCDVRNTGDDGINPGGTGANTTDSVIRGCEIENAANAGIHISVGTYGLDVEDCHLDGCAINFTNDVREVTISGGSVVNAPDDGVYTTSGTNFYGVTIQGLRIRNPGLYGIQMEHGEDHSIENVTVLGGDRGIDVHSTETDVRNCNIVAAGTRTELSGGASWGIVLTGGSDFNAAVKGNNVKGTFSNDDIYVDGTRVTVSGNACDGSINTGSSADYNSFEANIAPGGVTTTGANSKKGDANIEA